MTIRKIEEKDAENYLNMLIQLDSETKFMLFEPGERDFTPEQIRKHIKSLTDETGVTFILEDENKICGYLSASRNPRLRKKHCLYIHLGFLKNYIGKGHGTKMFQELEKWAMLNDIHRLELTVMESNDIGINLYKKMGFQFEGIKKNSLLIDGRYIDEYCYAKYI